MRKYIAGVLTAGVLFCALRWADLALWTDRETGLVTAGPVWARYLVLAALAGLALLAGHRSAGPAGEVSRPRTRKAGLALSVPAFAAGALYLAQGVLDLLGAAGVPDLARGVLEVLCALWLECLGQFWLLAGLRSQRRASAPAPGFARGAGQPRLCLGRAGQLYDQRFQLAPHHPHRGGVAGAGGSAFAGGCAAGGLPARRGQPQEPVPLRAAGLGALLCLAGAPVRPFAGRPGGLGHGGAGAAGGRVRPAVRQPGAAAAGQPCRWMIG